MIEYKKKNHLYRVIPIYNNREKVVASVNLLVGDWSAYKGKGAWLKVAEYGNKILQETAEKFFPELATLYVWRD